MKKVLLKTLVYLIQGALFGFAIVIFVNPDVSLLQLTIAMVALFIFLDWRYLWSRKSGI